MTLLARTTSGVIYKRAAQKVAKNAREYSQAAAPLTIGIRREDPERIWERRCPLTPDAVHELVHKDKVRVLVQECDRRIFTMDDFYKAGAERHSTLEPAQITVGIKETPITELITTPAHSYESQRHAGARTHLMFSHTIKGQAYNMPLLSRFLAGSSSSPGQPPELLPRLIDYELLAGPDGKRTVGFGWFAGVAGAIESLSAMAHAHLELGISSPFLYTPRPHTHPSLDSLKSALRSLGQMIREHGTPRSLGPLIIGVTGNGQVAKGVLDILEELPIVHVSVDNLPTLLADGSSLNQIYLVHAPPESYLSRTDGKPYERSDYYANPTQYKSDFCTNVAPYLSLLVNCAGWAPTFPRLMDNAQLAIALELAKGVGIGRMASIGDISCDIEGGLEFLPRSSTLSTPFFVTRPPCLPEHLPDVQMMAVDILPTSIPYDASVHFSQALMPYLRVLVRQHRGERLDTEAEKETASGLQNAVIAEKGVLTARHEWLQSSVDAWRESASPIVTPIAANPAKSDTSPLSAIPPRKKRVLLLGSGMVAGPTVEELTRRQDIELIVASNSTKEATTLVKDRANAKAILVDMTDATKVDSLVSEADVVISLLPVSFHPKVAEMCVKHGKHMVTASYISPAMRAMNQKAQEADVLLLNEIGLDPGIDHCSAISLLSDLKAQGKEIVSFISFCGGLPAPECADVPLGYKFSWSPKGVLLATLNGAKFRLNGKDCEIAEKDLLNTRFPTVPISNSLRLEGIANRDSSSYGPVYDLPSDIRTLLRGTLRYPGYSELVQSFKDVGLLSNTPLSQALESWDHLLPRCLSASGFAVRDGDHKSTRSALIDVIGTERTALLLDALQWLGLVPSKTAVARPSVLAGPAAPIDHLTNLLASQLRYGPQERDLVLLSHEVIARPVHAPVGTQEEIHTSQLITYGTQSASAMSRTVGLPVAFATLQILDGEVTARGVQGPTHREIYRGILSRLDQHGLGLKESVRVGLSLERQLARDLAML